MSSAAGFSRLNDHLDRIHRSMQASPPEPAGGPCGDRGSVACCVALTGPQGCYVAMVACAAGRGSPGRVVRRIAESPDRLCDSLIDVIPKDVQSAVRICDRQHAPRAGNRVGRRQELQWSDLGSG